MPDVYDVIIVGGGYAGLCCGLKLRGRKVLLLEGRNEIARKHRGCQCGLYTFGESFELGNDVKFHQNNVRVPGAVMARLAQMELVCGGHKLLSTFKNPMPIIDEGKVKGVIEDLCREGGVEIITGEHVTSVETDGQVVSVHAGKKYRAKYLLGADGANSRVAQHLPLQRRQIGNYLEMEIEADHMDIPDNGMYGELKGIKVGIFAQPYGGGYMLGVYQGLGMQDKKIDLKKLMEESIKKLNVRGITRKYGCSIPIRLSASSSFDKNIIMAGDSVGSFSMITITGAMMAGLLAGEALLKKMDGVESAFEEYDKKWRKLLYQRSMDGIRYGFFLLRRLNEKRLGRLFGALEGSDLGVAGKGYYLMRIPGIVRAFF
jgi:flavin-dependent dehydrogenase